MARYVASTQAGATDLQTWPINIPAGATPGDLLFLAVRHGATPLVANAGWTEIRTDSGQTLRWRPVDGTEGANLTLDQSAGLEDAAAVMLLLRATRRSSPTAGDGYAATLVGPSVTATAAGLLIGCYSISASFPSTATAPAGMTQREFVIGDTMGLQVCTQEVAAGATGTRTASMVSAPNASHFTERAHHVVIAHGPQGGWGVVHV